MFFLRMIIKALVCVIVYIQLSEHIAGAYILHGTYAIIVL